MPKPANKVLKELQVGIMIARTTGRISEMVYKQLKSSWGDSWDLVAKEEEEPLSEPLL